LGKESQVRKDKAKPTAKTFNHEGHRCSGATTKSKRSPRRHGGTEKIKGGEKAKSKSENGRGHGRIGKGENANENLRKKRRKLTLVLRRHGEKPRSKSSIGEKQNQKQNLTMESTEGKSEDTEEC